MEIAAFALQILMQLPALIKAGVDVSEIINNAFNTITKAQEEGRDITAEEWEKSNDEIAELQAELAEATKDIN